jgi:hypothetical protein
MNTEKITRLLKISMIIGGIVDSIMVIVFLMPFLRILIFGESSGFHTSQYEWSMRLLGSLGAAWTVLLFWASKKPFERKDILFFTVFPLMFGAYSSTLYGFLTKTISLQFFILFTFITFAHCPFFLYIWIKAKRAEETYNTGNKGR